VTNALPLHHTATHSTPLTNTLPAPSASEVTTLCRYTNLFVIIIIIIRPYMTRVSIIHQQDAADERCVGGSQISALLL